MTLHDCSPRLRELAHRLRNHTFTISMAIAALELSREDPERFAALVERTRKEPVVGLEEIADALDDLAASQR